MGRRSFLLGLADVLGTTTLLAGSKAAAAPPLQPAPELPPDPHLGAGVANEADLEAAKAQDAYWIVYRRRRRRWRRRRYSWRRRYYWRPRRRRRLVCIEIWISTWSIRSSMGCRTMMSPTDPSIVTPIQSVPSANRPRRPSTRIFQCSRMLSASSKTGRESSRVAPLAPQCADVLRRAARASAPARWGRGRRSSSGH